MHQEPVQSQPNSSMVVSDIWNKFSRLTLILWVQECKSSISLRRQFTKEATWSKTHSILHKRFPLLSQLLTFLKPCTTMLDLLYTTLFIIIMHLKIPYNSTSLLSCIDPSYINFSHTLVKSSLPESFMKMDHLMTQEWLWLPYWLQLKVMEICQRNGNLQIFLTRLNL